jgi:hypothetical protein
MAVVGMAVATLVMGACGGDKEPLGPTATVPQATTTTNPYAIPPVIDEAYVNRVLAGLDHAVGDVVRLVVSSKTIPPEAIERLKALYVGDALQLQVDGFQREMFSNFYGYRNTPGDQTTRVTSLISVVPKCIFAEVDIDFSAVSFNSDPQFSRQWVALVPLGPDTDQTSYNPTPWAFIYQGFKQDLSQPSDPCADF